MKYFIYNKANVKFLLYFFWIYFVMEVPWSISQEAPIFYIKYYNDVKRLDFKQSESIFPENILLEIVNIYTGYISPMFGKGKCRYFIKCSSYARESIKQYGFLRGFFMSVDRVMRCHQFQTESRDDPPYAWW